MFHLRRVPRKSCARACTHLHLTVVFQANVVRHEICAWNFCILESFSILFVCSCCFCFAFVCLFSFVFFFICSCVVSSSIWFEIRCCFYSSYLHNGIAFAFDLIRKWATLSYWNLWKFAWIYSWTFFFLFIQCCCSHCIFSFRIFAIQLLFQRNAIFSTRKKKQRRTNEKLQADKDYGFATQWFMWILFCVFPSTCRLNINTITVNCEKFTWIV